MLRESPGRSRSADANESKHLTLEEIQNLQEAHRKPAEEAKPTKPQDPEKIFPTLQNCYTEYLAEVAKLPGKYARAAGLLGVGTGPKDDACHEAFYDQVGVVAQALAEAGPDETMARAAVELILFAPETYEDVDLAVMMLTAAQGHAIVLIPYLAPAAADELLSWYDRFCPRNRRLPVQKQVASALKKAR